MENAKVIVIVIGELILMQRWDGLDCVGLQKVWMGGCVMDMVGGYARGMGRHRIESEEHSKR